MEPVPPVAPRHRLRREAVWGPLQGNPGHRPNDRMAFFQWVGGLRPLRDWWEHPPAPYIALGRA
eukprot:8153447-Heterocapsa_arctica.AAC.1